MRMQYMQWYTVIYFDGHSNMIKYRQFCIE